MTPFEAAKSCTLAQLTGQEYPKEAYEIWINTEVDDDEVVVAIVEDAIDFWEKSQGDRVIASIVVSCQFSTGHSIVKHEGKMVVKNLEGNIIKILK